MSRGFQSERRGVKNPHPTGSPRPPLLIGKTVSHYRILRELGHGGMGDVFLAQDLKLPRQVALKYISDDAMANPTAERRFEQEAALAARIDHPYVCKIYETHKVDGRAFLVMEFVDGETLQRVLKSGPLPVAECIRLGREIADALQALHDAGILHRDLKPGNLMLTPNRGAERHIKLMDFGLAKPSVDEDADTTSSLTPADGLIGTLQYLPPERVQGRFDFKGGDIFAFGIVLFEMITGVHPFAAETPRESLALRSRAPAPSLTSRSSGSESIPEHLERIVARMLERNPERRYQSALEVFIDLGRALEVEVRTSFGARPGLTRVAVLPFEDWGAPAVPSEKSAATELFLCDGIVEDLIFGLSGIQGLQVASRTSAFRFKGGQQDQARNLVHIGRQLGVDAILEGSLRRSGDRLRITARLFDVRNDTESILWADRYDRHVGNVFEIQDEISRAVVRELRIALIEHGDRPLVHAGTSNFGAYEVYLKGLACWNRRTPQELAFAVDYFREAITRDPDYARAHAALADSYTTLSIYGADAPGELMPLAGAEAELALDLAAKKHSARGELDGEMTAALIARGSVRALYQWNWPEAEADFRRAIELRPRSEHAHHWYATNCLLPQGRLAEARLHLQVAKEFGNGSSTIINTTIGLPYYLERDYEVAIKHYRRALAPDDTFGVGHYFLGLALAGLELFDEAVDELERALELSTDSPETGAALAYVAARAGDSTRARRILGDLRRESDRRYVSPVLMAQIEAALGERDRAFREIERAVGLRSSELVWLKTRPTFDSIRQDPRFGEVTARIFPC